MFDNKNVKFNRDKYLYTGYEKRIATSVYFENNEAMNFSYKCGRKSASDLKSLTQAVENTTF